MFLCDFGMMIEESEGFRIMCLESGASLTYYWDGAILGQAFAKQTVKPITPKSKAILIDQLSTTVDKFLIETKEGAERVWQMRIQRGTSNTIASELIYALSTLGLSLAPENWLLVKSTSYMCNMGMSMWTSFNPGPMWAIHCKKYLKDIVNHDLEAQNITNMRESLPDLLFMLRDHDRKEILRALDTGSPVVPMEPAWTHEWDVRGLALPQPNP